MPTRNDACSPPARPSPRTSDSVVTFLGIGLVVNIIVVYIAIQVRGEHRQNKEYLSTRHTTRV